MWGYEEELCVLRKESRLRRWIGRPEGAEEAYSTGLQDVSGEHCTAIEWNEMNGSIEGESGDVELQRCPMFLRLAGEECCTTLHHTIPAMLIVYRGLQIPYM